MPSSSCCIVRGAQRDAFEASPQANTWFQGPETTMSKRAGGMTASK
jgi:hypothetical protein